MERRTKYIRQKDVVEEYGISVELQETMRKAGRFAEWLTIGRTVFYDREDLEKWLAEQKAKTMASHPTEPSWTEVAEPEDYESDRTPAVRDDGIPKRFRDDGVPRQHLPHAARDGAVDAQE